jgi:hypothetical protein
MNRRKNHVNQQTGHQTKKKITERTAKGTKPENPHGNRGHPHRAQLQK